MNREKAHNRHRRRQQRLAEAWCGEGVSLADAMNRCGVSAATLRAWMDDAGFEQAIRLQLRIRQQEGRIIIGRSAPKAAEKLTGMLQLNDKEETARKACLDVLSLGGQFERQVQEALAGTDSGTAEKLPDATAQKLLRALTEDE
ncbi:MAG: hypothetical protein L0Y36_01230 [Planctomycetales bacterium]|nr:hypothetical protein [Planctomycetales bacterium]